MKTYGKQVDVSVYISKEKIYFKMIEIGTALPQLSGYLKNSRLFSKKLTSNYFCFSVLKNSRLILFCFLNLKNSRLIRREIFKENNLKNSRLIWSYFFFTKGGSKLSPLVRWSLKRKFGLKKDFKMGLG